jgi:hypothetical protein
MFTAVVRSLTPSETVASTDATSRPRSALVAPGAEHVPRICATSHAELDPHVAFRRGHVRERAFSVMQAASLKARPGDVLESPLDLQYR